LTLLGALNCDSCIFPRFVDRVFFLGTIEKGAERNFWKSVLRFWFHLNTGQRREFRIRRESAWIDPTAPATIE
jgi:hypothetical protein